MNDTSEPRLRKFLSALFRKAVVGFLFLLLLFVLSLPGFSFRLRRITGDAMDWRSGYLAGFSSTNCGRILVGQDASKATECALKAYAEGRAFRVAYDTQGIDSLIADGIVGKKDGQLLALSFDGCPSGCGFGMTQQRLSVFSCPKPYHLYVNPKGRVNCFSPKLGPY